MDLFSWLNDPKSSGSSRASQVAEPEPEHVYIPDPFGRLGRGRWDRRRDPFGRQIPGIKDGWPLQSTAGDPFALSASVGGRGADVNRPADVAKVEEILGRIGHLDLGATGGPTGYYGARMRLGVERFQKEKGLAVDGRIEPGGETIRALSETLGGDAASRPKARPVARQQVDRIVDGLQAMDRAGIDWRRSPAMPTGTVVSAGYPQTGGKPAVGPDTGNGGRGSRPGEAQVAIAPLVGLAAEAVPWLLGAVGAGMAGKQLYDQHGEASPSGRTSSSGEGAAGPESTLTPEMALRLYGAGGLASLGKALLDRSAGADRGAGGRQAFDALDLQLPNRTEFPSEPPDLPRLPGMDAPLAETSAHEGRPAAPVEPFVETLPDLSGEFEGFNVQEHGVNVDLDAGEPLPTRTRKALVKMQPREREVITKHILNAGTQTQADKDVIIVEQKRSFKAEGEDDMENFVRGLGGDPQAITGAKDGQVKVYKDKKAGYTVELRSFSSKESGGHPTLEFRIERSDLPHKFMAKLRYLGKPENQGELPTGAAEK